MPKIPEVQVAVQANDIGSVDHALAVARVLAGRSKREDTSRFLAVIRVYLKKNKDARNAFKAWYEELEGEEATEDDGDTPRKKKKKKKRDEE